MTAIIVRAKPAEKTEELIRRFQKKVLEEGVLEEYRERERYKKPAERRKEAKYRLRYLFEQQRKKRKR